MSRLRLEAGIEIEAPVEAVYDYWDTLENLPNIMSNIQRVLPTGPDTTRWYVTGPLGRTMEWETVVTRKEPNALIAWDTVRGSVRNSGQVRFKEVGPSRTRVDWVVDYPGGPPGGRIGQAIGRVIADPKLQLEQDLKNLKDVLEGKATLEEVKQRSAIVVVQSSIATFLASGTGLLLVGAGVLVFSRLRRKGVARRKRRIVLEI